MRKVLEQQCLLIARLLNKQGVGRESINSLSSEYYFMTIIIMYNSVCLEL